MFAALATIARYIDTLNEYVGRSVSWLTTLLVMLIGVDVLMRYFLNNTRIWVSELEWHMYSLVFLLGAAYALKHDRHVRVDVIYAKLTEKGKAWVNLAGVVLFLLPFCVILIQAGWEFAMRSYRIGESSPDPSGLPAFYPIKFSIAIGMSLLLLQAISMGIKSILIIVGRPSTSPL
ncbi:MAG: TRAP transporter small permease subunit [Bacteroidota bacterium]